MRKTTRLQQVAAALSAVLLGSALTAPGGEVTLKDIVPDYMEGDLETAILPTPQKAELEDTCLLLEGEVAVAAPAPLALACAKIKEFGYIEKRTAILAAHPEGSRERNAQIGKLDKEFAQFRGQVEAPGWPNPFGMAETLLEIFPHAVVAETLPDAPAGPILLLQAGPRERSASTATELSVPETGNPKTAGEAYALRVKAGAGGQPVMEVAGASPWGTLWGLMTLRQMVFSKDGKSYVRKGAIQDWPYFWFRGGKRGKDWWGQYKANASFGDDNWGFAKERLARVHNWWVKADEGTVKKLRASLTEAVKKGATIFLIDYNDGDFRTKDSPGEKHPGNPALSVKYLLDQLDEERKALGAEQVKIGYMGAGYSLGHEPYEEAKALKDADALAKADVMVHNGLEVFTFAYPKKAAETYREIFGFRGDLILYDCQCLRKCLDALDLESGDVHEALTGLSLQNASLPFTVSAFDYAWNPAAYDPARSLKVACREWAKGKPEVYKALYDIVSHFNRSDFVKEYMPRDKLLEAEAETTTEMIARIEKARPVLEKEGLQGVLKWLCATDVGAEVGHRPHRRQAFEEMMAKHGFPEYHVNAVETPIVINGKLDEAAWQNAPVIEGFLTPGYTIENPKDVKKGLASIKILPRGGENIVARALYDGQALYYSFLITGISEKAAGQIRDGLKEKGSVPTQTPFCWRHGPTVEIYLNPGLTHVDYWQLVCTAPNEYKGVVQQFFDPDEPQFVWDPKPDFRFDLQDESTLVVEGRLPWSARMKAPKKGDVWSADMQAYKMLKTAGTVRWAFSYETWGQVPHRRFGRWIFE